MSYLISSLLTFFAGIYKEINEKLLFVKKHINLKNSFVSVVFVCFFNLGNTWGQVNYNMTWAATGLNGWTSQNGNFSRTTNSICATTASVRANIYSANVTGNFASPSLAGNNGQVITMTYQYKIINWSGGTATPNNFGTLKLQYAADLAGPWTDVVGSIISTGHSPSTSCVTQTVNFTPPSGTLFVRFNVVWANGDYYMYFDDVNITQAAAPPCSGNPSAGTATILSSSGCSGVNFNLSASGLSIGTGITYQWQSSPTGAAPWTDIAGANASTLTTSTTNTMYYQLVTICSNSGQSATTNVVPYNVTGTGCAGACPTNIPSVPVTNQSLVCNSTAVPGALNATNVTSICGGATTAYMGGKDAIYTFTPATSGSYTISYNGQTWSSIFVYSGACPASGGTCVGSVGTSNSSQSLTVTLTAGVQYFIWFDTYPTPNSPCPGTFSISAPTAPYDPCASIPTITDCSTSVTANFSGTGAGWDVTSCFFNTPGQERIFQFTAPTTGTYTLNVSAISGGYIDFFWKATSGGCNSSGWNCVDDISVTGTYNAITPMTFTAGITYYILLDPEGTGTYSATFNLVCPCNPNAPTGNATQTFCSSSTPTIASLIATGTDIKWYYAASGGNLLPTTLGLSNGATYYASQTIGGVESNCRLAVTVTINPVPVSPAITGSTNLCWDGTTTLTPEYPTGGTITNSGGYRIHTFTTDGTLMVPAGFSGGAEVLVVGGGGGGGSGRGGGGGAGGLLFNSNFTLTAGTSYTVTIGAGGAAETNGNNSVFGSIIANGGGRGGSHDGNSAITTNNGQNGGSGGGAAINFGTSIFNGGTATTSQGNNGGTSGTAGTDDPRNTGGGGGFAEAGRAGSGGNATWTTGVSPKGGDGLYFPQFQSFGSSGWFAGGGGGSKAGSDRSGAPAGAGGQGGGGAGSATGTSSVSGVSGIANTGGGGGGGDVIVNTSNGTLTTIGIGGSGGSGIVIVRYYIGTPTWSSQNTSIATVSNGVVTGGAPGGSTTIDYTVAGVGSCPSTTVSTPINIIGGRRIAPTGAQCSGTQLNFEALPNPSVSGTTISWNVTTPAGLTATPTSGTSNLFSTTLTNSTSASLTPTITVSQTIGALTCSRDFKPTIIALPTVSLNCPNFCAGTPIDITATPTPAGTYTYNWTALPGGVSDPGNSATVNTSTAGMYTVIATNTATNCASEATSCTIAVQNPPSINAISPP